MGVCSACGHANEVGARFCSACGALLAEQVEAAAEERKIVTVLFVDLVGFTSRAEQLDPEDVRALLTPYFARVREELERYGGTVEKFIGDAVLALFGAPVAHEDDPERAVRAALAIRDWIRSQDGIKVRIGVNTGEALVSLGVRPSSGEGMAAGDVVNTGARLQAAAPVNGVLVGERTYRATRRVIDYAEAEPVTAKGKERPVQVWEAVAARARLGVDVPAEARTPLVGRDHELAVMREVLARVLDQRAPQLLTLVGTPGVGKSRLLYELSVFVNGQPELISWRQGRSLPYGEGASFWALAEMVKAHAGIHDTDTTAEVDARLAQMVADDVPATADPEWILRHLRRLVVRAGGADQTHPLDREESFAAWRGFFEALAETRPLVLVFEDLHWADDGLLDFVDHLGDWLADVPVLIVCTARPELLARRPAWAGGKSNAITVSLSPLTDGETAELLSKLVGAGGPDADWGTIVARSGGNPLYAEQYASLLAEARGPASELPLPETVQGIIGARLDSLDPSDKRLLQHAAVIGKVFWPGVIGAVADGTESVTLEGRLQGLCRKQFIRRDRSSSVAGQHQYVFLHILVRDVAYGQLPRATRIDKHLAAAAWIECIGAAEEFGDMLAHHYLTALELAQTTDRDVGDIVGPARAAVRAAGERAYALGAVTVAMSHFEAALSLHPEDDSRERVVLLFMLARAKGDAGLDPGSLLLTEASEQLQAVGEVALAAEAEARLSRAWSLRGDRDRASHHLACAEGLVRGSAPSAHKALVLAEVARYHMLAGDLDESAARESLELAELLGRDDLRATALTTLGQSRVRDGDSAGIAMIREAVDCAEAGHYAVQLLRARNNLAFTLDLLYGDKLEAMRITRETEALALRMGNATAARWAHASLIGLRFELGDWTGCERTIDAFLAESAAEPSYHDAYMYSARALLRVARDDVPGAIDDTRSSLDRANQAKDPQVLLPTLGAAAYLLFEAGRVDESDAVLSRLLAQHIERRRDLGSSIVDCVRAADLLNRRDELALWLGRDGAGGWVAVADDYLAGAFSAAAEKLDALGMRWPAAHAHLRAARALATDGDRDQARGHLDSALAFFEEVGATHYIRQTTSAEGQRPHDA